MKFHTKKINKIYKNEVHITATVDPNDANYVTKNSTMYEKDFDESFGTFLKLGSIIGIHFGLEKVFNIFENDDDDEALEEAKVMFSDSLYRFLPCTDYSDFGNNSFGHTLKSLNITYYDECGIPWEVDLTKPLENTI